MKLTNRVLGWSRRGTPRETIIGKVMVTKEDGSIVFETEQPISKAIKTQDYKLDVQLRNGVFRGQEMPMYYQQNSLAAAEAAEQVINNAESDINYMQAKERAQKLETKTEKPEPSGTGSATTENV